MPGAGTSTTGMGGTSTVGTAGSAATGMAGTVSQGDGTYYEESLRAVYMLLASGLFLNVCD